MTIDVLLLSALAAGGAAISFGMGALVRAHGASVRLVDVPNPRSSHVTPTPRGGGIGIVAGTLCGALLLQWIGGIFVGVELAVLIGGGLLVAGISLVDDAWGLPALARLGIHLLAASAAALLLGAVPLDAWAPAFFIEAGWAALLLTILWIAGMTNAYNFMDGIDGLAGAQAVIAACAWAVIGWWMGRPDLAAIGVLMGASSLGFLAHNWHPARLFMGDVGSAFLGYSLAVLTVIAARQRPEALAAGALALWPFVFDPLYTLVRRIWRRENLLEAHRSHLYQRLVGSGWSHGLACALYIAISAAGAAVGVMLVSGVPHAAEAAVTYAAGSVLAVAGLVHLRELRGAPPVTARSKPDRA